ncbi:MAG: hypothetical protein KAS64_05705 [Spirochaetes bacterium]|nr:hypothetical protein [Spirochaetota bacterium]
MTIKIMKLFVIGVVLVLALGACDVIPYGDPPDDIPIRPTPKYDDNIMPFFTESYLMTYKIRINFWLFDTHGDVTNESQVSNTTIQTAVYGGVPEGLKALKFTCTNDISLWHGVGYSYSNPSNTEAATTNMTAWNFGYLHFWAKVDAGVDFQAGIKEGLVISERESWKTLQELMTNSSYKYPGYAQFTNDGNWYRVRIPLSSFKRVPETSPRPFSGTLTNISFFAIFKSDPCVVGDSFYIDDVYWQKE